jgi:hypothetical protein
MVEVVKRGNKIEILEEKLVQTEIGASEQIDHLKQELEDAAVTIKGGEEKFAILREQTGIAVDQRDSAMDKCAVLTAENERLKGMLAPFLESSKEWGNGLSMQAEANRNMEELCKLRGMLAESVSLLEEAISKFDEQERRIKELEGELESHSWEISPAMAQAKIEQQDKRIKVLTEALEMLSGHDDRFVRETVQAALKEPR